MDYDNLIIFNNCTYREAWHWNLYAIFPEEKRIELIDPDPDEQSIGLLTDVWRSLVFHLLKVQIEFDYEEWELVHSRRGCFQTPKECDSGLSAIFNAVAISYRSHLHHPDEDLFAKFRKLLSLF